MTLHELETILRKSDVPMKMSRIKEQFAGTVDARTLRDAIDHYRRLGFVSEGSQGVMWTLNGSRGFWGSVLMWDSR